MSGVLVQGGCSGPLLDNDHDPNDNLFVTPLSITTAPTLGAGYDTLYGGDDALDGGDGSDYLHGGDDVDTCRRGEAIARCGS